MFHATLQGNLEIGPVDLVDNLKDYLYPIPNGETQDRSYRWRRHRPGNHRGRNGGSLSGRGSD